MTVFSEGFLCNLYVIPVCMPNIWRERKLAPIAQDML
jgi:hypothetical protein